MASLQRSCTRSFNPIKEEAAPGRPKHTLKTSNLWYIFLVQLHFTPHCTHDDNHRSLPHSTPRHTFWAIQQVHINEHRETWCCETNHWQDHFFCEVSSNRQSKKDKSDGNGGWAFRHIAVHLWHKVGLSKSFHQVIFADIALGAAQTTPTIWTLLWLQTCFYVLPYGSQNDYQPDFLVWINCGRGEENMVIAPNYLFISSIYFWNRG